MCPLWEKHFSCFRRDICVKYICIFAWSHSASSCRSILKLFEINVILLPYRLFFFITIMRGGRVRTGSGFDPSWVNLVIRSRNPLEPKLIFWSVRSDPIGNPRRKSLLIVINMKSIHFIKTNMIPKIFFLDNYLFQSSKWKILASKAIATYVLPRTGADSKWPGPERKAAYVMLS